MRKALLIIGLLVIGFLGWNIYIQTSRIGKIKVTVSVLPEDAVITVDGEEVGHTMYLEEGTYKFRAEFLDFTPAEQEVHISKPLTIKLVPLPDSPAAQTYLIDHPEIQKQREAVAGQEATETGQTTEQKYPYLSQLPVETPAYSIYPGAPEAKAIVPGSTVIALHVSANSPQGRAQAVKRIIDLGIDPSSVEIVFDDMVNEFQGGVD
jgi:hypothetical protein